jgi:hypothetical protein
MLLSWRGADTEEQLWGHHWSAVIQWQAREVTHITVRNDRVSLGGQTFGGTRVA